MGRETQDLGFRVPILCFEFYGTGSEGVKKKTCLFGLIGKVLSTCIWIRTGYHEFPLKGIQNDSPGHTC